MKNKIIAKRYAVTFIETIAEDNCDENYADFNSFVKVFFKDEKLQYVLKHPEIALERKVELLRKLFGTNGAKKALNFVCLLVKRQRIGLIKRISEQITYLYRKRKGIKDIKIKTAVKLTKDEMNKLRAILEKKFGKLEITEVIDPSIIGGIIVCFEEQVLDESIKFRLKKLKEAMIKVDNMWLASLIEQPGLAI